MAQQIAFDSLAYAKKLKKAGFSEEQAEVQAEALTEIIDEKLATKQGLKELEISLKRDMKDLKRDMKELELRLKNDLTLRFGAMMAASIAIIAALIKFL